MNAQTTTKATTKRTLALNVEPELYAKIKGIATEEHRNISGQLRSYIMRCLKEDGQLTEPTVSETETAEA